MSRISCPVLSAKIATAEESMRYIHHGDNVGFSGFTGAGYPKAVPAALAAAMVQAHEDGREFQGPRRSRQVHGGHKGSCVCGSCVSPG